MLTRPLFCKPVATLAALTALAGGLTACGGEASDSRSRAVEAGRTPANGGSPAAALPARTVENTAGGRAELPSLAPRDRPLLVWFWAPH